MILTDQSADLLALQFHPWYQLLPNGSQVLNESLPAKQCEEGYADSALKKTSRPF